MDLDGIADGIERAFKDVTHVRPCRLLGGGFHNLAIETAGGVVFRIGRDGGSARRYEVEHRLLPAIAGLLPAPVPVARWFAERTDVFPNGVLGYVKLQGKAMSQVQNFSARLPRQVAEFLIALHAVPLEMAREAGVLESPGRTGAEEARRRVTPVLRARLDAAERNLVERWWDGFIADERVWRHEPVLIHSDLWYENVLVDEAGDLAGVIDFDHPAIGDRAQDLATLRHLGDEFAAEARAVYLAAMPPGDGDIEYRERRLWEYREIEGIDWAIEANDEADLEDGIAKLRRGPILNHA